MAKRLGSGRPPLRTSVLAVSALIVLLAGGPLLGGCRSSLHGITEELTPFDEDDGPDALETLDDWIRDNPEHKELARAHYLRALGHFDWLLLALDAEDPEIASELAERLGKRSACTDEETIADDCMMALLTEVHELFGRVRIADLEGTERDSADMGAELTRPEHIKERNERFFRVVATTAADNTDMAVRARAMKLIHARRLLRGLMGEEHADLSETLAREWGYPCPAHFAELPSLSGDDLEDALEHCELEDAAEDDDDDDDSSSRSARGRRASRAALDHSHARDITLDAKAAAEARLRAEMEAAKAAAEAERAKAMAEEEEARAEAEAVAEIGVLGAGSSAGAPGYVGGPRAKKAKPSMARRPPIDMDEEWAPTPPSSDIMAEPMGTGFAKVESDPAGATVLVDGESRGITPVELVLPPGDHKLRLTKDGYAPYDATVEVMSGEKTGIYLTLSKGSGEGPLFVPPPDKPPIEPPDDPPDTGHPDAVHPDPPTEIPDGPTPIGKIIIAAAIGDIVATVEDAGADKVNFLEHLPDQVMEALKALRIPAPFDAEALGVPSVSRMPASAGAAPRVLLVLGAGGARIMIQPVLAVSGDGRLEPASGAAGELAPPGKKVSAADIVAAVGEATTAAGVPPDAPVGLTLQEGLAWSDAARVLRGFDGFHFALHLVATAGGRELKSVAPIRFVSADTVPPTPGPDSTATTLGVALEGSMVVLVRWGAPRESGVTLPMLSHDVPNVAELSFTLEGATTLWGGSVAAINKVVVVPGEGSDGATVTALVVEAMALSGSPEVVLGDRLLPSTWAGALPHVGPVPADPIGVGPGTPAPDPPGGLGAAIIGSSGTLDKAVIQRVIRRSLAKFKLCYETSLIRDPSLSGKVTVKMTIGGDGKVTDATASGMDDADLLDCMTGVARGLRFPEPLGGGIVNVSYPFVFSPAD